MRVWSINEKYPEPEELFLDHGRMDKFFTFVVKHPRLAGLIAYLVISLPALAIGLMLGHIFL